MANTTIEKPSRGGRRPGAGRKDQVTKIRRNFTIDAEVASKLDAESNQSGLVNELLKKHYKNVKPK